MVKKARIKFLIFTIMGVILFFAFLFGVVRGVLKKSVEREIASSLTEIEMFYPKAEVPHPSNHFVCEITLFNSPTEFSYAAEVAVGYSGQEINEIVRSAVSRNYPLGSIGYNYYKVTMENNVPKTIVVADFSSMITGLKESINFLLVAFIIIVAIISVIAWLFSFWVFKPVEENLFKQREFISDVSHELKTPVAIISANADVLKNKTESEYVENIRSQSKRMSYLVNDLLTLSSIEEGTAPIKKEVFCASETILKSLLPFDAVAFEKGKFLKFNVEENIMVKGVKDDLIKICDILMENAVKYSTKGEEIVVNFKKDGKKIFLSVFNKGCNVKKEDKERIFERFFRADESRARNLGGSGLGLSIANSLCKRNNWKIKANSIYKESMEITIVM